MEPNRSKSFQILSGIIPSNIVASVLLGVSKYFWGNLLDDTGQNILVFSNFVVVPAIMGLICAHAWRGLGLKTSGYLGWTFVNMLASIPVCVLILREGAICLIIIFPLVYLFMAVGVFVGRILYKDKGNKTLQSSAFGILLVLFLVDTFSDHENIQLVSDTIIVNAPIEKVWPLVVEYEPIKAEENFWLFKAGMPSPVQSTVDGHEVGAGRKCIFSNGYVFDEKMVVYKPNEELTFDIVSQPRDPEIMGHIDILRGQFILKDNGDGTTTLIGNSWYKLYVFPKWYFDLWAKSITRNVHLRVMDHIKILSEKNV